MTDITPPPELVKQWAKIQPAEQVVADHWHHIATCAAQWGADQELEACCEWLKAKHWIEPEFADELRAARRPNPPSLKEKALIELGDVYNRDKIDGTTYGTIRRALEQLPDHE